MRKLGVLFGVILAFMGLVVVLSLASVYWRYSVARGEIKDVFLAPVPPDQSRLQVVFEFTVDGKDGKTTYCSRGGNQVDTRFHHIDDPVLPKDEAQRRARSLLGDDPHYRQTRTVYYHATDPAGTAFIVTDGTPARRYECGLALMGVGLLLMLFARPRAKEDT